MSEVEKKQGELAQAQLAETYDAAVEAYRNDPSDENKATKDDLANQLVAARQAVRQQRESEAPGDGEARPGSIEGSSEVSQ